MSEGKPIKPFFREGRKKRRWNANGPGRRAQRRRTQEGGLKTLPNAVAIKKRRRGKGAEK